MDFNSRTHVECDVLNFSRNAVAIHFNSRTHVECDCFGFEIPQTISISTHALTWSATGNKYAEI